MINAILLVVFYLAAQCANNFKGNEGICLFVQILAVILLGIRFAIYIPNIKSLSDKIKEKLPRRIAEYMITIVSVVVITIMFLVVIGSETKVEAAGIYAFENDIANITELIEKEKYEKALEKTTNTEEIYGCCEKLYQIRAKIALAQKDYEEAYSNISYLDGSSLEYYCLYEEYLLSFDIAENFYKLEILYLEAAKKYPNEPYYLKKAGIVSIDNEEYEKAEYYLIRCNEIEPGDPDVLYYLGVSTYYQNLVSEAVTYFEESIEEGADENIKSYIAWYVDKLRMED